MTRSVVKSFVVAIPERVLQSGWSIDLANVPDNSDVCRGDRCDGVRR